MDKSFRIYTLSNVPIVDVPNTTIPLSQYLSPKNRVIVRNVHNYKRLFHLVRDWTARVRARAAELRGTMGGGEGETYDCAITHMAEYEFDFYDDLFIHK